MIVGIGVDVVNVPKFRATLLAAPAFSDAIFTTRESQSEDGTDRSGHSLAARYAAKEAVAKAMGLPGGVRWHDAEVLTNDTGQPYLRPRGALAEAARAKGIGAWHVSLATEGDVAVAYVVAEARPG